MRTSLITESECIMWQIQPINSPFTEPPKPFLVFIAGNSHDPSGSFPYHSFRNMLKKYMRAQKWCHHAKGCSNLA